MNISKKSAVLLSTLALVGGVAGTVAIETHAATPTTTAATTQSATTSPMGNGMHRGVKPAAFGTVTAVSGNTVTITDTHNSTTYTVDATNATITKITAPTSITTGTPPTPTTITVSGIAVGDTISVEGTVSGTSVTATKIMDGMMGGWGGHGGHGPRGTMGTVAAISGNTITLTGKNGTTYTIDAASSAVKKVSSATLSDIAVGDTLDVSGTTSGTTVTATNIVDGQLGNPKSETSSQSTTTAQ